MKRILCCGILAASVVAGYVHWRDNQLVYSLNIYSGGWAYGPSWRIGPPRFDLGFEVRREVGMPNEWGKKRDVPTFTDFEIGGRTITMRGDAYPWLRRLGYSVVAMGIAGLFLMLITSRPEKTNTG